MKDPETVTILLVDDDEVDAMAVLRAFKKHGISNPIVVAGDGLEAMEILRGDNGREPLSRPFLILLDLNMPRMDGWEFLDALRRDSALKGSLVYVLASFCPFNTAWLASSISQRRLNSSEPFHDVESETISISSFA